MTAARYSWTAMLLHWLLAAALAFQYGLGEAFAHAPRGKALFDIAQFHKSIGITILLLSLVRLAVRFTKPRPAPLGDTGWAERLASVVHWGLYAFMIFAPLTGWLAVTSSKFAIPTFLFGSVPWPDFPFVAGMADAAKASLHGFAEGAHGAISKLGLLLFLLHVVGALRHQFLLREPLIQRMVPLPAKLSPVAGSAIILALAGSALGLLVLGERPGIAPSADAALAIRPRPAEPVVAPSAAPSAGEGTTNTVDPAKEEPEEDSLTNATAQADEAAIPAGEIPRWQVAGGGRLGFTTAWSDIEIDGRFSGWSADIRFNPDAVGKSAIKVTIDLATADTGDGERDSTLKGGDFFDSGTHPKAVWTSGAITALGGNRYRADGTLALRGVSKPVPLSFTLDIKDKDARVSGSASLNRTAFGVGQGDYAKTDEIPDPVRISFAFRAKRP